MKNQKKFIIEIFIISLSILFSSFIWRYILIPYTETDIIGIYSNNNYNENNDLIRYLFFIGFPLLIFILLRFTEEKKIFLIFLNNLRKVTIKKYNNGLLDFLLLIFISFIFFEFFSIELKPNKIDVYHDGQLISSAFKNYQDKSLWSGSYVITGIFNEMLATKISWNFFNTLSIGSAKFSFIFLILINKILLTIFAFQISKNINLNNIFKCINFLFLFLIFHNLIDYNLGKGDLYNYRELPILLLLLSLPYLISQKKSSYIIIFLFGFISLPTLFWSLDRGIIFNLLIFIIIFYFALIKHFYKVLTLLISILVSWIFFSYLLGDEFSYFLSNSTSILREINNIHGIIHPTPFSSEQHSTRATKGLLAIIISIIIALSLFLQSNKKYNYYTKFLLLFISICCFFGYLNAIGRSDGGHIKSSFAYPLIFFTIYIFYNFFYFLEKKFILLRLNKLNLKVPLILLIIIIAYFGLEIKPNNIYSFKTTLKKYVNSKDKEFISNDYEKFIEELRPIIKDEKCIQLFTNNAILPYLLRKKSCTKYYFVWAVGSRKIQEDFINELVNTRYIIVDKVEIENDFSPAYRLKHIKKHINKHYKEILSSYKFKVLKKKN